MSGTTRLDNRACLYGEARLSDVQVIALRGASADDLRRTGSGWFTRAGSKEVASSTIAFLERHRYISISVTPGTRGKGEITGPGKSLLAKIDAEAAHG